MRSLAFRAYHLPWLAQATHGDNHTYATRARCVAEESESINIYFVPKGAAHSTRAPQNPSALAKVRQCVSHVAVAGTGQLLQQPSQG